MEEITIDKIETILDLKMWCKEKYPILLEFYQNNKDKSVGHIIGYLHRMKDENIITDEMVLLLIDYLNRFTIND